LSFRSPPPLPILLLENTRVLGAGFALVITAMGVFSVATYSVTQRAHEIGVRLALGARPADIIQLIVLTNGLGIIIGIALGLCGAVLVGRILESFLFQLKPVDLLTYTTVSFILVIIGLLGSCLPAFRAIRVDPNVLLRYE
jgi:putative ABC transport system permease protein